MSGNNKVNVGNIVLMATCFAALVALFIFTLLAELRHCDGTGMAIFDAVVFSGFIVAIAVLLLLLLMKAVMHMYEVCEKQNQIKYNRPSRHRSFWKYMTLACRAQALKDARYKRIVRENQKAWMRRNRKFIRKLNKEIDYNIDHMFDSHGPSYDPNACGKIHIGDDIGDVGGF